MSKVLIFLECFELIFQIGMEETGKKSDDDDEEEDDDDKE